MQSVFTAPFTSCATTSTPTRYLRAISEPRAHDRRGIRKARQLRPRRLAQIALSGPLRQGRPARQRLSHRRRREKFRLRQLARTRAHRDGFGNCQIVLAESFARIFFRNCVATGELYPCEITERLCDVLKTGDIVTVELDAATITVKATSKVIISNRSAMCAPWWTPAACSITRAKAG